MQSRTTGTAKRTITEIREPRTRPTKIWAKPVWATDRMGREAIGMAAVQSAAAAGPPAGQSAAGIVANRQIDQDQPDQGPPDEQGLAEEGRQQPCRRELDAEAGQPAGEGQGEQQLPLPGRPRLRQLWQAGQFRLELRTQGRAQDTHTVVTTAEISRNDDPTLICRKEGETD